MVERPSVVIAVAMVISVEGVGVGATKPPPPPSSCPRHCSGVSPCSCDDELSRSSGNRATDVV